MTGLSNPALDAFVAQIKDELIFAQLLIARRESEFALRHVDDRNVRAALEIVPLEKVRDLAQSTASGTFRPLKSAPTLRKGWTIQARDSGELEWVLNAIYPGSIADWYAAHSGHAPITSFRDFINRQTGMYRLTQKLSDAQAARVVRAGCDATVCLKRRLWTTAGLDPDPISSNGKSAIPCLEPCALLLEFSRKTARCEQEEEVAMRLGQSELDTLVQCVRHTASSPNLDIPDADFDHPLNPRRIRLALARWENRGK